MHAIQHEIWYHVRGASSGIMVGQSLECAHVDAERAPDGNTLIYFMSINSEHRPSPNCISAVDI